MRLYVNLTVTTLNTKLARILEPRAPRPDLRLQALSKLTQAGLNAGVICAPVLPGITDSPAALDKLVRATKEAGGKYIYANPSVLESPAPQASSCRSSRRSFLSWYRTIASAMPIMLSSARPTANGFRR